MSDVWELKYNASALSSNTDTDGDSQNNSSESVAGTDPFNSSSILKFGALSESGGNVTLSWVSLIGKRYQVQSCTNLTQAVWINEGSLLAGNGGQLIATLPVSTSPQFFHVIVTDADTDGDGAPDWDELQVGFNPNLYSTQGNGTNDLTAIQIALASTNVISVQAANPYASMDGPVAGAFQITRSGNLNAVTVPFATSGTATAGVDYVALPGSVTLPLGVNSALITVTPISNVTALTSKLLTMTVQSNAAYTVGSPNKADLVIDPLAGPTGTGLFGQYFDSASTTYANATNFSNFVFSRVDTNIFFNWGAGAPTNTMGIDTFSIRWTGQVQPEHTEAYYFFVHANDGVKLWVDGQLIIDRWTNATVAVTGTVSFVGGVRYDIKLEYFENTGNASNTLHWWSPSQTKQVIPMERLYPNTNAAANVTSELTAVGLTGGPFSHQISGSNLPFVYGATGLPPGLTLNPATGLITGTPTVPGNYKITLSVTNGRGTGYAILDLTITDTGGAITRDYWTGIPGTSVTNIPVDSPPTGTGTLTNLVGITDFGGNYGERMRGYITAPVTGNYYFWIAAKDTGELWISNDSEPVNKVRRAFVTNGTPEQVWTNEPNQKSPWLALVAGQKYYVEILHKAGIGTNDNWAVGWLRPDATTTNVVPGCVLWPYVAPVSSVTGTLYATTMLAQGTAQSVGVGTATLRLSPDETQAVLAFKYTNLTTAVTSKHVHSDPYLAYPSQIIFDIDDATPQPDGSYIWDIEAASPLTAADIVEVIKQGKAYINIHTVNYPNGEIRGNFTLANGSQTFTPPPAPPSWTDDHSDANAAARFLLQTTFGPSSNDIAAVQSIASYDAWISDQFAKAVTYHLPVVLTNLTSDPTSPYPSSLTFNSWWQNSVTAQDQLRQRVAFALSEILVVSDNGVLNNNGRVLSAYYDALLDNAFGNFREILETVTLTPAMGLYLDMRQNDKGDLASGRIPNENFAREILQLFSIGLYRLWPDGTLVMDSKGNLVPTYDQNEIIGYARLFTGWNYNQPNQGNGRLPTSWNNVAPDYINPMKLVPTHHEFGDKRILDNVVLPPATGNQTNSASVEFDNYGLQDLESGLDAIFNHSNVGPLICRQLIQRLVTSNPSRDYLYRVVQKFNDNGAGVRGDMQTVIKAILLDSEARSTAAMGALTFGKQREPLLRATATARAFPAPAPISGTYSQSGGRQITVTTPAPHKLATGNNIYLQFTSGTPLPTSTSYSITNTGPTTFMVNATGLLTGTYAQVANTVTITTSAHGLILSNRVHLTFTTGGASNGAYEVTGVPTSTRFSVTTPNAATLSGNCLVAFNTGGYTQSGSNITVSTSGNHGLSVSDLVYIDFMSGTAADGQYQVTSIVDEDHFTVLAGASANQTQDSLLVAPLAGPPLFRSGNVNVVASTWNMNTTDNDLTQTPLRSPTVFNYYFPDFKFPGTLASAGLTTPEFQLTSDSNVALQFNFLAGGIINGQGSNTNGLNSFKSGGGAIMMDFGPWMKASYTSSNNLPVLVDALNSLLLGGQLSTNARTIIVGYVGNTNNFAYTTPTQSQMRDRVRAVIHLIVTSPAYTIQK